MLKGVPVDERGDARVIVVGGGGHAGVVAEALGRRLAGYLAPEPTDATGLGDWLGSDDRVEELEEQGFLFALGVGAVDRESMERRRSMMALVPAASFATVVHRAAVVLGSAALGAGSFVGAGAVIGTGSRIGVGAIINTNSSVDHDCVVGSNVHVAPGVTISGGVQIGDDTLIGVGASIRQQLVIGDRVVVGAGSVVICDLVSGSTAYGVPAREFAS